MAYLLAGPSRSRRNECKIKQAAGGAYLPCGALLFGAARLFGLQEGAACGRDCLQSKDAELLGKPIKKRAGRSRVAARFAR